MTTVFMVIMFSMVTWCLWIRRLTWKSYWERSATICVAQSALGALLMTPMSASTLGVLLYHITGQYNLQDFIGLSNETGATSALYVGVLIRVVHYSGEDIGRLIKERIEYPQTIILALMLATFGESSEADRFYVNFLGAPMDPWLTLFWVLFCGFMIYMMFCAAHCLLILRRIDPDSYRVANMYLVSIVFGVFGCILRTTTALFNDRDDWPMVIISSAMMGCVFTFACIYSWRRKIRWFKASD